MTIKNSEELVNVVYDTLMRNTGPEYPQFDPSKVENQEIDGRYITFNYEGSDYRITIEKTS